jgi:hypothetical protein
VTPFEAAMFGLGVGLLVGAAGGSLATMREIARRYRKTLDAFEQEINERSRHSPGVIYRAKQILN